MLSLRVIDNLIQTFSKLQSDKTTDDDFKDTECKRPKSRVTPDILNKCLDLKEYANKQKYPYIHILSTEQPSKEFIAFDNQFMASKLAFIKTYESNPSSLFTTMDGFTNLIRPVLMSIPMNDTSSCKCIEYKEIPNTKCYWIQHNKASLSNGVILVFPGTAYVHNIAHHQFASCELLSRLTGCVCIVVQYKTAPKFIVPNPQITDGLNVYQHFLTTKKVLPQKIVCLGDSSGAGLVLLLLQRLGKTHPDSLPKCALINSAWCHLQHDIEDQVCEQRQNYKYDSMLSHCAMQLRAKCALGQMDNNLNYIASKAKDVRSYDPTAGDFRMLKNVAMYFSVGATEALLWDTLDAAHKAYEAGCKTLRCDIYPYMFHSSYVFLGKYKEAEESVRKMAEFILENIMDGERKEIDKEASVTELDDFPKCEYEPDPGQVVSV